MIFPYILLIISALIEVVVCSLMTYQIIGGTDKEFSIRKRIIYIVGFVISVIIISINRADVYFGRFFLLQQLLFTNLTLCLLVPNKKFQICSLNSFFLIVVDYLDLAISFIMSDGYKRIKEAGEILYKNNVCQYQVYFFLRVFLILVYFIYKKYEKKSALRVMKYKYIIAIIDIVCAVAYFFFRYNFVSGNRGEMIPNLYLILSIIASIFLVFSIHNMWIRKLHKRNVLQLQGELMKQSYSALVEQQKRSNFLLHDFKNHLSLIHGYLQMEEYSRAQAYILSISDTVTDNQYIKYSKNKIIDAVLRVKIYKGVMEGINIQTEIEDLVEMKVQDFDICVILSNLLDNALEACEGIVNIEKWIHISLKCREEIFIIKVENGIEVLPSMKKGRYVSEKDGREMHGLGIESVRDVVGKYNGTCLISHDDNKFTAIVTLFL